MYSKTNGILKSSVEYLFKRIENYLNISIVELYNNQLKDLIGSANKLTFNSTGKSIITNAQKSSVSTVVELQNLVDLAMTKRVTKSTNQNLTSSRSHAFVIIERTDGCNQLVLADLAGFESTENKENVNESIGINAALTHFNKVLLDLKQNLKPSYHHSSRLAEFLQPILTQTKPIVFYHISPSNVSKYLNLIDKLMDVRVFKRPKENQTTNDPEKTKHLRRI